MNTVAPALEPEAVALLQTLRAHTLCRCAEVDVYVGTSFSVAITDLALKKAREGRAEVFSVDPHHAPPEGVRWITGAAEEALPALAARLSKTERA